MYVFPILQDGDSDDEPMKSRITLLEDGVVLKKGHELHDNIRYLGRGRYSHWGRHVYFSASDNTNPNQNGRCYTYSVAHPRAVSQVGQNGRVELSPPFRRESGFCWSIPIEAQGSGPDEPTASRLSLFEDDEALAPAHAMHDDIRQHGGGRYCHWAKVLYFSTPDGTDPNTNGRLYSFALDGPLEDGSPGD